MKKTKIVCTLGPACNNKEILREMINKGMNVARLNFSHGTHEYHKQNIEMLKELRAEMRVPLAILLDTKGPEVRTGRFGEKNITLVEGNEFTLTTDDVLGTSEIVSITYKDLPNKVKKSDKILVDDGNIELYVKEVFGNNIHCCVVHGGSISDNKSINIPNIRLDLPYLSEKDKSDVLFALENDLDFIAASFVRRKEDVEALKAFINENGGSDIRIISKIENIEGIENFDEILACSDGIMIARGDMGVEVDFECLPGYQKKFIKKCYNSGKMVITATQMLESMITHSTPTRAEITDVANAVFDGTSAIMLSGETAIGHSPVLAVEVMAKIALQAEKDAFEMDTYKNADFEMNSDDTTNAVCDAACTTAKDLKAAAIIAPTKCGQTARRMSKFRPSMPIIGATPVEKTYHQLALSWGVCPVLTIYQDDYNKLFDHAIEYARRNNLVTRGDLVVITAGIPLDESGNTNVLKVDTVR